MKKRPDVTSHNAIFEAILEKLNEDALYPLTFTDIVKICGERAFVALYPEREDELNGLPRKRYNRIDF